MNRIFWTVCRLLLSLRYRVDLSGHAALEELKGPCLVLPNHPAYIDPPIVSSRIRLGKPLRPLVFSGTYRMRLLRPLMWLVDAFEVPDMSAHSRDAQARALEMIDSAAERLRAGDNLLIYPSGRLQRGAVEVVGAARAVHEIVAKCPEVNIVLVRTRGIWGSMFSCAESGTLPNLTGCVWKSVGWCLASLLFFLPRRRVSMQVEVVDRDSLPLESKENFNRFLENWYNSDGAQEAKFVRYHHFLGPDDIEFHWRQAGPEVDTHAIKPKTIELVNELVQSHLGRQLAEEELQPEQTLEAIGLDSLDRMDVALKIEQQFGFRSNDVAQTLGQLWALADGQLSQSTSPMKVPDAWSKPNGRSEDPAVLADTIGEAFVRRALKSPNQVASADTLSGAIPYRRMLVGAKLMARRFAACEQEHVGLMLPASVGADLAFFGLQLAGKVPVMMNWTTGPANLAHGVAVTGVRHIVTSRKMIDRLGIEVEGAEYIFLEDIKADIGKSESLALLLQTYITPRRLLASIPAQEPQQTALFLFTSGSESMPKTVPLTHQNLITNVRAGLQVLRPSTYDSLLGFLPPFHSFGMTGNLLLPQLAGIRCVRHADPTDSAGLVQTIAAFRPSMVFTTPTFLGYIMSASQGSELHSLRKVVTGAEKCSEAIFTRCRELAPEATILEGYGITECSPVVSANLVGEIKSGSVGKPVDNVDVCVVDVDTEEVLGRNATGMLLVSGPSIFGGYYRHEGPSPFVEVNGRNWYRTGDLVSIDDDGFLHFQGRLKRFLKAGGEMISLPALEEPFSKAFPPDENGPRVAVEGVETEDGRHVVLFSVGELTLRAATDLLLKAGLRGVMRIDEVRQVDAIPVLGTGKTDYKELRRQILEAPTAHAAN